MNDKNCLDSSYILKQDSGMQINRSSEGHYLKDFFENGMETNQGELQ